MIACHACLRAHARSVPLRAARPFPPQARLRGTAPRLARPRSYATGASLVRGDGDGGDGGRAEPSRVKRRAFKLRQLQEEVRYLGDPLKLAEHTLGLLRRNDFDKALEIVRVAGNGVQATVSWNHLIDYELARGGGNSAYSLFNEVCSARGTALDEMLICVPR
jgi:hypothetical protein